MFLCHLFVLFNVVERLLYSLHNILKRGQPFISLRSIFNASRINSGVRKPNTFISRHRMFKVNTLVSHISLPFLVGGHCRQHFCNALQDFNLVLVGEVFNDHLGNCNNHREYNFPHRLFQFYLRTILRFPGAKIQQFFLSIIINCHPTW